MANPKNVQCLDWWMPRVYFVIFRVFLPRGNTYNWRRRWLLGKDRPTLKPERCAKTAGHNISMAVNPTRGLTPRLFDWLSDRKADSEDEAVFFCHEDRSRRSLRNYVQLMHLLVVWWLVKGQLFARESIPTSLGPFSHIRARNALLAYDMETLYL